MIALLFKLLFGHALADFGLQNEAMAKGKNRHLKPDYIPKGQKYSPVWPFWLTAHALIHGGMVYFLTGNIILGLIETGLHSLIDFAKSENWFSPNVDQGLHIACKVIYALRLTL